MGTEPVAVVRCARYDGEEIRAALCSAIEATGGFSALSPGMTVGLKANMVAGGKPETAITTHPVVLAELTRLLVERGMRVIVGDSPGGPWTAAHVNHVYAASGMDAVERAGGMLNRDFSEREAAYPDAVIAKQLRYTGWLDGCDALINVCKLKSHGMMGLSNAVKNLFGTVPGLMKPEYHFRCPDPNDFANLILDVAAYHRPVLHISDGVTAMEGNGPTQGKPYPLHALLVSRDPHALDWVAARLVGMDVRDVPTLQAARRRGLLPESFSDVSVIGDFEALRTRDFAILRNHNSHLFIDDTTPLGKLEKPIVEWALAARPKVTKTACVGCGKCAAVCPAKAIGMRGGLPAIDRKTCIRCFCCQEFCPKGAMRVHRAWLARLINR